MSLVNELLADSLDDVGKGGPGSGPQGGKSSKAEADAKSALAEKATARTSNRSIGRTADPDQAMEDRHGAAAAAHSDAAIAQRSAGNNEKADYHESMAKEHEFLSHTPY